MISLLINKLNKWAVFGMQPLLNFTSFFETGQRQLNFPESNVNISKYSIFHHTKWHHNYYKCMFAICVNISQPIFQKKKQISKSILLLTFWSEFVKIHFDHLYTIYISDTIKRFVNFFSKAKIHLNRKRERKKTNFVPHLNASLLNLLNEFSIALMYEKEM